MFVGAHGVQRYWIPLELQLKAAVKLNERSSPWGLAYMSVPWSLGSTSIYYFSTVLFFSFNQHLHLMRQHTSIFVILLGSLY